MLNKADSSCRQNVSASSSSVRTNADKSSSSSNNSVRLFDLVCAVLGSVEGRCDMLRNYVDRRKNAGLRGKKHVVLTLSGAPLTGIAKMV